MNSNPADTSPEQSDRRQNQLVWLGVVGWVGLVVWLDVVAGTNISLRVLYLPALVVTAWTLGLAASLIMALIAACSLLFATSSDRWFEPVWIWEVLVRFLSFGGLAVAVWFLRRSWDRRYRLERLDPLTEVGNRTAFLERADAEVSRCRRNGLPLSVAFLDCDDFKAVNDSLGHVIGDEVLKTIAGTLRSSIRGYDFAARLGGDEFVLLLPDTDGEAAQSVTERIRADLDDALRRSGWPSSLSVGVVTFLEMPDASTDLIRAADEQMYRAKRTGRGGVSFHVVGAESLHR